MGLLNSLRKAFKAALRDATDDMRNDLGLSERDLLEGDRQREAERYSGRDHKPSQQPWY